MKDIDPEYILCNQDLRKNVDGSLVVIDQTGNNLKVQQVNKQTAVHSHTVMLLTKVSSVQSLSPVQLFATPWTAACQASLSITNSWSMLKLMSRVSDAIQPSHPLLSSSPPAFNLSQHQGLFQ